MKLFSRISGVIGIFSALLTTQVVADSDVRISIDEGVSMAQPIAVVPFKASGVPADVAQIISDDLRNSGKFTPLERSQMPAQPGSAAEVVADQWSAIGIDNIVVGQVSSTGGGYNVAYQLIDTLGTSGTAGGVIAQGSFIVPAAQIRQGAHTVSDEVFEN